MSLWLGKYHFVVREIWHIFSSVLLSNNVTTGYKSILHARINIIAQNPSLDFMSNYIRLIQKFFYLRV